MVELILKPAGIPPDVYRPLLRKRDESTGKEMSKRQIAPLILDAIENRSDCKGAIRRIIEIASKWNSFHLANDEYLARGIVQKAQEFIGTIKQIETQEEKRKELARKEKMRKQSELLLMWFDELFTSTDEQSRGYSLQQLLNQVFDLYEIPVERSFTRNEGGEQIDGAFELKGWYYIVECRWRKKLSDIRELDGLSGQISRSGKQTMGLFLSINGWSENVCPLLKQNTSKVIILMDGFDLRKILEGQVNLRDLVLAKIANLNLKAEPYYGVTQYIEEHQG